MLACMWENMTTMHHASSLQSLTVLTVHGHHMVILSGHVVHFNSDTDDPNDTRAFCFLANCPSAGCIAF